MQKRTSLSEAHAKLLNELTPKMITKNPVVPFSFDKATGFSYSFGVKPNEIYWCLYYTEEKYFLYDEKPHYLMGVPPDKYSPDLKVRFEPLRDYFDPQTGFWITGGAKTGWWTT